jgi:hypothetical protein
MRAGVGGEVSKYKNSAMLQGKFVFQSQEFFGDDNSGLSAIGSVCFRTEF